MKAVCVLHQNKHNITGTIRFTKKKQNKKVKIEYNIIGLKDGLHGFHIHQYGDLTDHCTSTCAHFNPTNKTHGGKNTETRHVGDLGNILSKNNVAKGIMYDHLISLDPRHEYSIIGRAIVIHQNKDDLGKGKDKESKVTGNAGPRLACGIIGLSK